MTTSMSLLIVSLIVVVILPFEKNWTFQFELWRFCKTHSFLEGNCPKVPCLFHVTIGQVFLGLQRLFDHIIYQSMLARFY